jgi:hypothetical protein
MCANFSPYALTQLLNYALSATCTVVETNDLSRSSYWATHHLGFDMLSYISRRLIANLPSRPSGLLNATQNQIRYHI